MLQQVKLLHIHKAIKLTYCRPQIVNYNDSYSSHAKETTPVYCQFNSYNLRRPPAIDRKGKGWCKRYEDDLHTWSMEWHVKNLVNPALINSY